MSEAFSIRIAAIRDEDEILQCLGHAFAPYHASCTPDALVDTVLTRETIGRRLAEMTVLVAIDQPGHVIGTIAYHVATDGEGHLRGMAVNPEWQGFGVAQKLLVKTESDLRKLHCKVVTLDTTVPLQRAIRFYEKNGFRPTGKVKSFFGMQLCSYRKDL